ncbi:MAG: AzlC family ABC transporter permease [Spirochaetaceae bacterium]|jgi:4-azaleucine resistance transporter AzlC|nr:AzlC family ABC transporter permease [Spirochaetaceae bacterium]
MDRAWTDTDSTDRAPQIPSFYTTLAAAFRYSIPVLLGYVTLGAAFGLVVADAGYPWYLAMATSLVMYAGAGQFMAVGFFAAGVPLAWAVLLEFVVNARHMAYGLSMLRRYRDAGVFKPYLVFSLTDESFALLSSLPPPGTGGSGMAGEAAEKDRYRFMFLVSLLNQLYWNCGTLLGVLAGTFIPWNLDGIGFALSALFIVLMIEQILRVKKALPFVTSGIIAVAAVFILPGELSSRFSLLAGMIISLGIVQFFENRTGVAPAAAAPAGTALPGAAPAGSGDAITAGENGPGDGGSSC